MPSRPHGTFGRSHRTWRNLCGRLKYELPPVCHLCGGAIDLALHWNDRMAWTLDHVVPLDGDVYVHPHDESNLAPAHRKCNSSKGNGKRTHTTVRVSRVY
jgi:5-methylcytosine-specific restriction endonuclease McrA